MEKRNAMDVDPDTDDDDGDESGYDTDKTIDAYNPSEADKIRLKEQDDRAEAKRLKAEAKRLKAAKPRRSPSTPRSNVRFARPPTPPTEGVPDLGTERAPRWSRTADIQPLRLLFGKEKKGKDGKEKKGGTSKSKSRRRRRSRRATKSLRKRKTNKHRKTRSLSKK